MKYDIICQAIQESSELGGVCMDSKRVFEFYNECMNMDLGKMLELISNTESVEEKIFIQNCTIM